MVLFVLFLYNKLPAFIPKTVIEFTVGSMNPLPSLSLTICIDYFVRRASCMRRL